MARSRRSSAPKSKPSAKELAAETYRHKGKRKNNPPAMLASAGLVEPKAAATYEYSPRLPPALRFDFTGQCDALPPLLEKARKEKLSPKEVDQLAAALRAAQAPWLEWAGKRERPAFAVDPVALHIHERVSTQAILEAARKQEVDRSLFADPELDYREAVQFYRHDVDWSNRLILGDSLQVMASLAKREELAGKVQMIYIDPPYGIKFASNFQPEVRNREVKEKETDLTREPEMVRAYRDTWHLGIHSYLTYLRDRLSLAKELLAETGSLFVQISTENLTIVSQLVSDVFGAENRIEVVSFRKKTMPLGGNLLEGNCDYLLWFAKNRERVKYHTLFQSSGIEGDSHWNLIEFPTGERRILSSTEVDDHTQLPADATIAQLIGMYPTGVFATGIYDFEFDGRIYTPPVGKCWKTPVEGMARLAGASRLQPYSSGSTLRYVLNHKDYPVTPFGNVWQDTSAPSDKRYVVQTSDRVVQRCMLMTTDPGDLVLDPTCGSATTAYVAEQWGRRWITIDTSRVAVAIARQRLLTAKFDYYRMRDEEVGISGSFVYKTVPHVTLKSIAQSIHLDPIFAKHEPILATRLNECNKALAKVPDDLRFKMLAKLAAKEKTDGKKSITDADRRRWNLPKKGGNWEHWQVPFDTDADWPKGLQDSVTAYRSAWRDKMTEVNACIAANAEQEELVDQPAIERDKVRVSGPFTVEAVQPPEMSLGDVADIIGGAPEEAGPTFEMREVRLGDTSANIEAYLDRMVRFLRMDGVTFPNNKRKSFSRLEAIYSASDGREFHAEGRWTPAGEMDAEPEGESLVGVVFGPQYGAVTAKMIEDLIKPASRRYDDLVIAGFSFTAEAQSIIEETAHPKLHIHMAHVRPDINPGMDGLLKEQPGGQLFTVFGQPRTKLHGPEDGEYTVEMEGVDIYNPVENSVTASGADKVAAWFLDADYDGRTFCFTQAFFPDRDAWAKLARALGDKGVIDEERFAALSGTISLPFKSGKHNRVAVKVIDPRGNEVMQVHEIEKGKGGRK